MYDKTGEEHYNLISALHKSMRNSDPDAAVYWLARMLEAGEDPLYIARRVIRFASEDIGLADPKALEIAVAAYQACHFIGMPECSVHLTQAVVYMSVAPKSNSLYVAYEDAPALTGRSVSFVLGACGQSGATTEPEITGVQDQSVQAGTEFDAMAGVSLAQIIERYRARCSR